MTDTLVVAISQSGTTTDTNRTVDLVRDRGALGPRHREPPSTDLTDKADGVLYTSDGRDVEMSVASTKAFYAQIAAGFLLAWAIAEEVGRRPSTPTPRAPRCASLPPRWRPPSPAGATSPAPPSSSPRPSATGRSSERHQPDRGRGAAHQAQRALLPLDRLRRHRGQEAHRPVVRAADPGVRRRARGFHGRRRRQGGGDLPAHKAVADRRRHRRSGPLRGRAARHLGAATHPQLAFVLTAMAGHLFGYEAALAIDAQARPAARGPRRHRGRGRRARSRPTAIGCCGRSGRRSPRSAEPVLRRAAQRCLRRQPRGEHRGAARLVCSATPSASRRSTPTRPSSDASARRPSSSTTSPPRSRRASRSSPARSTPSSTRPRPSPSASPAATRRCCSRRSCRRCSLPARARDRLSYKTLRTLADLDPAVAEVTGLDPLPSRRRRRRRRGARVGRRPRRHRRSTSRRAPSATGVLRGTKHTVAVERQVFVTRAARTAAPRDRARDEGRPDRRASPSCTCASTTTCRWPRARGALQGYRNRWSALRDAVLETEPTFREDLLAEVPIGRPARRAHPRAGRPLASPLIAAAGRMIGIGVDLCEVDRMRTALERTPDAAPGVVHRRRAGVLRPPERPRPSATRPASRPRRP